VKVFVDANVLVSAVATRGLCADVMRDVFASHELVVSGPVLEEVERVLRVKLGVEPETVRDYVRLLEENGTVAPPGPATGLELADRSDLPILGAAVATGARVFVTGDSELLGLKRVGRLRILSPRGFWDSLRTRRRRARP
jgi:putative PIN family toxin of toxin-antitoxin system